MDCSSAFADTQTYYVITDHLGTPQMVTDQGQAVVWQTEQTPFGEVTQTTGTLAQPLRFPGQYADPETGYSYNYFRDYDPSVGRYVQSDPIGLDGGINTYVYVDLQPINKTDPVGLSPRDVQLILNTYRNAVDGMTNSGQRIPFPLGNNLSRTLNDLTGGRLGEPYYACVEQTIVTNRELRANDYDDNWIFSHRYTPFLPHHFGEARSSNPSDPVIIIDPWRDRITLEYR